MMNKTKKIVTLALLTAVSLVLFTVEAQLPAIPMIPYVKIGIANIITLFILHRNGFRFYDAIMVMTARVLIASLVTGNLFSLFFSFSGGMAALLVMLLFRRVFRNGLIWATSVSGAIAHISTQVLIAVLIYGGTGIFLYIPLLVFCSIISGLLTGFVTAIILKRVF